jgi:hypothetical protein
MPARPFRFFLIAFTLVGCGQREPAPTVHTAPPLVLAKNLVELDPETVRTADVSILFVGNSHTSMHDLPNLVCEMIRFRRPGKTVVSQFVGVSHLDDLAADPSGRRTLDAHPWKHVVLQAQKISASGRFQYSRTAGIDFAKRAKSQGANVVFFAEWGLKGDPANGPRHEAIYREMAEQTGAEVAAVDRAWVLALAERPDLPLHESDGNHQSHVGAFLTACVLYGRLTGNDPTELATFPEPLIAEADRRFLAEIAGKARGSVRPE